MPALDLLELRGAVAHQPACELATVDTEAVHARPGPKAAPHLAQPRGQEAPSLHRDGPPCAAQPGARGAPPWRGDGRPCPVVDAQPPAGFERVRDPVLTTREPVVHGE